jgi:hypothetical protein
MKYYNKINRNFKVKTRLYFNQNSHNRSLDSTPRFFVKIASLKSLERVGFTQKSEDNGYIKYQANFYGGKKESYLNEASIDSLVADLNSKQPYGFDLTVSGSKDAYDKVVKYDHGYQSFYKTFWEDHSNEIKTSPSETYPYLEVEANELVRSKFLVKTPSSFASTAISQDYTGVYSYTAATHSCHPTTNITVTAGVKNNSTAFIVDGVFQDNLNLGRNKQYVFTNTNTGHSTSCVSGILPFRIATGSQNGIIDGGQTLTSGVNVSGASSLTGSEILVLTTDENTPGLLYYHSPIYSGYGAPMSLLQGCSGAAGSVSHPSFTPYPNWNKEAAVTTDGAYTVVTATGSVSHCTSNNVRGWTSYPNADISGVSISGQSYSWQIPTVPSLPSSGANSRVPMEAIGVALNGIPIYNTYSSSGVDINNSEFTDDCNGYVVSGNGKYNYRKDPKCTYVDVSGEHSPIVGYAFDGHPIYGPRDETGVYISDASLDQYHGHTQSGRGYHYHVTTGAPYTLGAYYKGVPNTGNYTSSSYPPVSGYPTVFQGV